MPWRVLYLFACAAPGCAARRGDSGGAWRAIRLQRRDDAPVTSHEDATEASTSAGGDANASWGNADANDSWWNDTAWGGDPSANAAADDAAIEADLAAALERSLAVSLSGGSGPAKPARSPSPSLHTTIANVLA